MKKNIIIIGLLLIISSVTYAGDNPFNLPALSLSKHFWLPKFRPFATTTVFTDSTNYVTLNKAFYAFDSIKTNGNLITKGGLQLDTNGQFLLNAQGYDMYLINNNDNGSQYYYIGNKNSGYRWLKTSGGSSIGLMTLDTATGLVTNYDIYGGTGTHQIHENVDTASDYNSVDKVSINVQNPIATTKSLTTAALGAYVFEVDAANIITANSNITVTIAGGTNTVAVSILKAVASAGKVLITIGNLNTLSVLNGTIKLNIQIKNQ